MERGKQDMKTDLPLRGGKGRSIPGGFTFLSNRMLQDRTLSLKAKGLLSVCLSLPPDWSYSIRGLSAICKESRDAIQTGLEELEALGYLVRQEQGRKADGSFSGVGYVFREQQAGVGDGPYTDHPDTGNPPQQNKKQQKKQQQIPHSPRRQSRGEGGDGWRLRTVGVPEVEEW